MSTAKKSNDKVSGVELIKVNEAIVDKYLAHYGVKSAKDSTLADKVRLLAQASRTQTDRSKLADCDKCGGDSDIGLPECPYCGEGGTDDLPMGDEEPATSGKVNKTAEPQLALVPEPEPEPEPKPEAAKVRDSIEPKPEPKKRTTKKAAKAAKVTPKEDATQEAAKSPEKAETAPVKADVPKSKGKGKKAAPKPTEAAIVSVPGSMLQESPEVTGVEIVAPTEGPIVTEGALDVAVKGVHEAKRATVVSHWTLGAAILRTFENDAWKQRRNTKGASVYRGFKQFCEAELGMSSGHAYKLMDIAATFSEEDVAKIGVAKLGIALRLPAQQRIDLLEEVRDGMPLREVADKVRALANGLPQRQDGQGKKKGVGVGKGAGSGKAATTPSTPASVLTTTHKTKRTTVKLVKAGAQDKRARKLADKPVGVETTLNGIEIRYTIGTDAQGDLTLIIDRSRTAL